MIDTSGYTIKNVPNAVMQQWCLDWYDIQYLDTEPVLYLWKQPEEPHFVVAIRYANMRYRLKTNKAKKSDFRRWRYRKPQGKQLELF